MKDFLDIAALDKNQKYYWKKRAIDKLKHSFDLIKESREFLMHDNPEHILGEETETRFQLAGKIVLETAKYIRELAQEKKEEILDEQK